MRHLRATRLLSVIKHASSMPLVVATDDADYIVKLRGAGQGLRALAIEVIVAELAEQVGLKVPRRAVVELSKAMAHDEGDPEILELIARSEGENLGLAWLHDAAMFGPTHALSPELASRIVLFDTLTMNVDRRAKNPNLLVHGGDVHLIDHGAVLLFEHASDDPALQQRIVFEHVLAPLATDIEGQSLRMRVSLDRPQIARAVGTVPRGWLTDEERRAMVDIVAARVAAWSSWSERIGVGNVDEGGRASSRIRGTLELLGETIDLSARSGLHNVRVEHERLRPGRRSSSAHFHTKRDELVYVLAGTPTLVLDGHERRLNPGDYVGFPAGIPRTHFLRNDTSDDAEYLVVASCETDDEVRY